MASASFGNIQDGLGKAGISSSDSFSIDGLFTDLNAVVILIIGVAAIWTVSCIIFAAMKLSSSQGNAQKRIEGIVGLVFADIGGWAVFNAYKIYGWFAGIGAS